jgi:hypothetical protein
VKSANDWKQATRVLTFPERKELLAEADSGFPKDKNNQIEWGHGKIVGEELYGRAIDERLNIAH